MHRTRHLATTLLAAVISVGSFVAIAAPAGAGSDDAVPLASAAAPTKAVPVLLGRLSSPSLGAIDVFETVPATSGERLIKETSLNVRGAGHIAGTVLPGELGVSVVAGHRTSGRRPFKNLNKVTVGEIITWTAANGAITRFEVVELAVLSDKTADATESFDRVMQNDVRYGSDHRLTLYACTRAPRREHPWSTTAQHATLDARATSTAYRLVVFAVEV